MRAKSVDGWLNECAAVAENGADLLVYKLLLDNEVVGYITAKCDAHAVNVAKKHHGAARAVAGWGGRERAVWAHSSLEEVR